TAACPTDPATKYHHPAIAPARSPSAMRASVEIPPASGKRLESAAKTNASGTPISAAITHATNEAGPARTAASAGKTSTPAPRMALVYNATAAPVPSPAAAALLPTVDSVVCLIHSI